MSITLAYLAAKKQNRVKSATLFAAQVDFSYAGDLMVFVDEERVKQLESHMKKQGYLEASRMANTFNMLRSNDLIWPYIVNNYMRGKMPLPFDILYWNSDATRMPAANHSFYLRNCYLDNKLTKGEMEIAGVTLDLHKVKVPVYNLATVEDHIAPAKSVLCRLAIFWRPGEIRARRLWSYRRRDQSAGEAEISILDWRKAGWRKRRKLAQDGDRACGLLVARLAGVVEGAEFETASARKIGRGKLKSAEKAPGSYVGNCKVGRDWSLDASLTGTFR